MAPADDERHAEIRAHQAMVSLVLDDGATHHMVGNPQILSNLRALHGDMEIRTADGFPLPATHIGDISIRGIEVKHVYLVPRLTMNLISVRQLAADDIVCTLRRNYVDLSKGDELIGGGILCGGLYQIYYLDATGDAAPAGAARGSRQFSTNKPIPCSGVTGFIGFLSTDPSLRDGAHQPPPLPAPADEEVVISNLEVPLEPKVDSGASIHMTSEIRHLSEVRLVGPGQSVKIPDGRILQLRAIERIRRPGFDIPNVYLVDELTETLISVGQLATDAQTSADSVDFMIDSGRSLLAPAASLDEQLTPNNLGDERNNKPRSNGSAAITSSAKTTCVPLVYKRTDNGSQHHSDPDSGVTERGNVEETKNSDTWVLATSAAHHVTGNRDLIADFEAVRDVEFVYAADGTQMQVLGRGNVVTRTVVLSDVWYAPELTTNLVSVGQLAELDYTVEFGRAACLVSSPADGTVVGRAHTRDDGLYVVDYLTIPIPSSPRRRIDQHTSTRCSELNK